MRFVAASLVAVAGLLGVSSVAALPGSHAKHRSPPSHPKTASDFFVDGKHIPGVPFQVSDSYAGLLPLTSKKSEKRKLFFWWYPSESNTGKDDLTIWLNGGPGCSSLEGLLQENGPWLVPWNTTDVVKNPYSWTKLSNVLWIEQPVGVGLGKGNPDITNEKQMASEFYSFLVQFFATFPQLKNKRLWLTGESYAGDYIPHIADEIQTRHSAKENKKNGINYQGFAINDPSFASNLALEQLPAVEFGTYFQKTLGINDTVVAALQQKAKDNGVQNFIANNVVYPPKGPIKLPANFNADQYDAFDDLIDAATEVNPCFNIYQIEYKCPSVMDPLGYPPDALEPSANNFINNVTGFKSYIHADQEQVWYECVNGVFVGGDKSPKPQETKLLQRVIESSPSKRSVIQHGELDAVLIANGSALALQNTTWNGLQGFQSPPKQQLIVEGKPAGRVQSERGLTFVRIDASGHMIPQDQPAVAYKLQQYLLGQIALTDLSQ